MKNLIFLILILLSSTIYAADTKLSALDALAAVADGDLIYIVDITDTSSKKMTVLNLFDTIDTFAELNTIVAGKTLVNEEDAVTWDALGTFGLGLTITTGDPFTFGVNRIDNGSDLLDGDMIGADTIDDDSIDFSDITFADFDFETNWKMWHSDGSGDVTEITLGANGTFLESNGAAAAPAFRVLAAGDIPDISATYEVQLTNEAGLYAVLADVTNFLQSGDIDSTGELAAITDYETGTGALVFATSPTLVTPILGTITSGVGTALTALNGENIQNATIDDDSVDWSDCTLADFDYETAWKMWHSNAAGDVTEITLGADGTFLESNGAAANPAFRALVDGDIPDNITVDLATLATTVTLGDDDATNDNQDIVFTTDAAGAVNLEADIGDFYYNPSTGTVTATEFVGGGSGLTLASTDLSDTAALLYETELDDFSELDIQIADKALVNLADGGTFTGNIIANGNLSVGNAGTTAGVLTLLEDDDDGANYASFMVPALVANTVYTLPPDDGDDTEVLQTNGGGTLTWVANAGATTAWDDIGDPDAAATVDFVTYTQTIDIGKSDSGGGSGLILDATGLGAGTDDVIVLEITTATNDDDNYIPFAIYDDSGADNDLLFKIDNIGRIEYQYGATVYQYTDNYISFADAADLFRIYFNSTDVGLEWSDGALNLFNAEDGVDAIVNIQGKDGGEKGILRVMSDGDDNYIELHHDDTDGHIITDTGDIHIEPAGGDIDFAANNIVTTGNADFGGGDLELPQATPATPDADGEIEVDFTDGKIVVQHGSAHAELGASTDVVMGSLIESWSGTIYEPDGVNDVITVKAINSIEFPHGVVITAVYLGVSSDTNYVLTVQNFDDFDTINAGDGTIDTVTYTADTTGEIIDTTPTYATIAAGQIIMISIPSTNVDWIHFEIYYYEPAG